MTALDNAAKLNELSNQGPNGIDALRAEFFANMEKPSSVKSATNSGAAIEGVGQVKQIELPANWAPVETAPAQGGSTFKALADKEHPEAKLCFYYRGMRVDAQSAEKFNDLLKQPDHQLSKAELQALSPITRDKYDPQDFALFGAATSTINGKRVLEVEGRYGAKQIDTRALYFDADGKGAVQEIYYQGPKDEIGSMAQARKALKNVQWR